MCSEHAIGRASETNDLESRCLALGLAGGTRYSGRTDRIDFVSGGRPSKLTPELVAQAQTLAAQGLPIGLICQQLGVHHATAWRWIQAADEDGDEEISLKAQFRKAINDSAVQLAKTHLSNLQHQSNEGNTQAATWLLTHHPALREHFSDAAADRRAERKTMATVLEAVAAVDLPAELEQALLLQMQARGLGTQAPEA